MFEGQLFLFNCYFDCWLQVFEYFSFNFEQIVFYDCIEKQISMNEVKKIEAVRT